MSATSRPVMKTTSAQTSQAEVDETAPAPANVTFGEWLRKAAPTAAVMAGLVALAIWGHASEWSIPKFSSLFGGKAEEGVDWCDEHNVPESICVECNKELCPLSKDYGWCSLHGVMQCPLEHPDVAELKAQPTITPAMLGRASRAIALRPRQENNSRCNLHLKRIQFASAEAVEKVGVDIAIVAERPVVETIAANGEIGYDQTRMAHFSSRVPGSVWRAQMQIGDRVTKGDVLVLIDAADVGRLKSEFLQALSQVRLADDNVERLRPLAGTAVPQRKFLEVEAEAEAARIGLHRAQQGLVNLGLPIEANEFASLRSDEIARRIQFLGLPPELVAGLDAQVTTSNLLPLRSSLDGVVVDRKAVEGEVVDSKTTLFDVADTSRLWLTLNVRQEDAKYVSLGQTALFRASDSANEPDSKGLVSWISTDADDVTRTVKVRVDLTNADRRLRANTFGAGRIVMREEAKAVVVPSEAIHWDGTCNVVFVRDKNFMKPDAPKIFHVRSVRPGVKVGATTEIIAGLLPGEVIASKNSVVLEAQLLKSNLGAGCACCQGK
jgi:cobalt-zinc-cadmium efflux system membrane fusion protein